MEEDTFEYTQPLPDTITPEQDIREEDKIRDFAKAAKATNEANDMEQVANPIFETDLEEKQYCGKCKREKVEGKCPACGRPTKYQGDEIMVAKVNEYLATCIDMPDPLTDKMKVNLPKREGLANFIDVDMGTLTEWEDKYPEFSRALATLDKEQKNRLFDNGLAGTYNSTIAKLILSSNHGMAEKTEQDIKTNGKEIQGLAVSFVKPEKE